MKKSLWILGCNIQNVQLFVHILITARKKGTNKKMNKCLTFLKVEFFLKDYFIYLRKKIVMNNTFCSIKIWV